MNKSETELLQRTVDDPLTPPEAREIAKEMLGEKATVIVYRKNGEPNVQQAKDDVALSRFSALIETCRRFGLENVPLTFEQAEIIMRLAQTGYLHQYVKRNV